MTMETKFATTKNKYQGNGNESEDYCRILKSRRKVYHDELDVLTLLDSKTCVEASNLWKKIANIPEERRCRLLDLLTPKHIEFMWNIAGQNLGDSKGYQDDPSNLLLGSENELLLKPVSWSGSVYNVIWPLSLISRFIISNFQKHFFRSMDGNVYSRVTAGGNILSWMLPTFMVAKEVRKVDFTGEPCHGVLSYGDGQLHLSEVPKGFPKPGKLVWPLNDGVNDYIRPIGPGVIVGQSWIEGNNPHQVPKKGCDFIMIKDYNL